MREAAALGAGIAQAGMEGTVALLAAGSLVTVLDAHAPPPWAVWIACAGTRGTGPRRGHGGVRRSASTERCR